MLHYSYFTNIYFQNYWGAVNYTLDNNLLEGIPIWVFPSNHLRITLTGFTKAYVNIGKVSLVAEAKIMGA